MKRVYSLLSAVLAFVACQNVGLETDSSEVVEGNSGQEFKEVIITASIADGQQVSRTTYNEDEAKNYWTPGDKIKVFSAGYTSEFTSINTAPAPVVNFKGVVTFISGSSNDDDDSKYYVWGLYPYSDEAVYEEPDGISRTARITTTYPDAQVGVAGTFGDGLSVMIGRSESLSIPFRGAYSGAFFQVSRDDIVSMTLRGLNGETLAGTATIGLNSALTPVVHSVADPKESVTVTAPNGTFEPGVNYYLVTLPDVALPDGYSVTLERSDGSYGTYEVRANRPLNRIKFRNLSEPVDVRIENEDNIANGTSTGWMRPDGNIVFADPKVKSICVENWDTDGDGELSYTEAAAVKTIPYGVFSGEDITSFDEFQYFTEVTKLEYDSDYDEGYEYYGAFSFSSLKSIKLPSSLKTISFGAFSGCGQLEEITIPATVTSIGMSAFHACTGLTVHMESATPCSMFRDAYGTWDEPYAFGNQFMGGTVKVIYVPDEAAAAAYKSAQYWSTYSTIIHPEGWVDPSQNIVFADPITELICVSLWDTNGDEALSYAEAAAVTDLTSNFQGSEIVSFDELQYFTGLMSLPNGVFKDCSKLQSISLPASLTEIAFQSGVTQNGNPVSAAFSGCSKLSKITIPSAEMWFNVLSAHKPFSIRGELYVGNDLVTQLEVPAGTTSLADYLFYNLCKLEKVTVPEKLKTIGRYAFYNCSNLTDINIPETVTSIGDYGFFGCSSLVSLNTSGVTTLGVFAFRGCSSLANIDIDKINVIPEGAFVYCSSLDGIRLSESATTIDVYAFSGCSGLTSIEIPGTLRYINESAFQNCTSLSYVGLPEEGLLGLGNAVFSGCSSLKSISLPKTLSDVNPALSCRSYNPVMVIGWGAFYKSGLETIECYDSLLERTYVEAYDGKTKVKNYFSKLGIMFMHLQSWYDHPTIVEDNRSQIKEVIVKKTNITYSIPGGAFKDFNSVETISLPAGMTSIGANAFQNCVSLSSITIPKTVSSIGGWAFVNCESLTNIVIPSSVTALPLGVFSGCKSLSSINIPEGVTSIGSSAFRGCTGLTSINVPEGVTIIEDSTFSGCTGLTSINIPDGVTSIGGYAFDGCAGLTSIVIPNNVTSISSYTFRNCTSLSSMVIPEGVTSIGGYAYYGCSGLTNIVIPDSVESIGEYAFFNCTGLTSITCLSLTPPELNSVNSFNGTYPIFVPSGSLDEYKTANNWSTYASRIQAIVKPFPAGTSFDPDAYITYVSNHQEWGNLSTEQDYMYDTQFSTNVSGTRIEMKFQIPDYSSGEAILSQGSHLGNGLAIDASNVYQVRFVGKHKDGDTWYDQAFDSGVGSGIDGTGVVVLTASCDGNQIVASVNGNETTIPVAVSSWSFNYLFSYYDYEGGDGSKDEYLAGVPDGAKLYYVKIWNGDDLVYFGHASRSVCSFSSEEEYCWYEEVGNKYTFARNLHTLASSEIIPYQPISPVVSVRQAFGGGID